MKAKKYFIRVVVLAFCAGIILEANIWGAKKSELSNDNWLDPVQKLMMAKLADERGTLRGLSGVAVRVGEVEPEVEKYGLTKQKLQTDVELRLRQNGIKVLSLQERLPGMGLLRIGVTPVISEEFQIVGVHASVEVRQLVFLERDLTIACMAMTWRKGAIQLVGLPLLTNFRETVKDLVDQFCNDYLAANPKTEGSKNNK